MWLLARSAWMYKISTAHINKNYQCAPGLRILVQYLIGFCCRREVDSDFITSKFVGPIVLDMYVKFCDPCLNRLGEIEPKAV